MTRRTQPAPTPAHTGRRRGHTSTSAITVGIASRLIIYSIIITTSGATVRSNIVIVLTTTNTNTTTTAGRRCRRFRRFVTCEEPQDWFLLLVRLGGTGTTTLAPTNGRRTVHQGAVPEADATAAAPEPMLAVEIVHGRRRRPRGGPRGHGRSETSADTADDRRRRRWWMVVMVVVLVLVLDGYVPDRFIGRGLDVRARDLRLLTGRPYLQIPVRPPFPIRQGHVVRTPADGAGAAQVAVVVEGAGATVEATAAAAIVATGGGLEIAVA